MRCARNTWMKGHATSVGDETQRRRPIGSAKNAPRRSARQEHLTDAPSAACGTPRHTLHQSTKTRDGACIAFVCRVMPKNNVLFATRTKQRNFSAPPHGTRENLNEECAYVAKLKLTARGRARPVANKSRDNNFPSLSPDGHQERMARKHAIHAVLPWSRIQSASVLPRPPLRE